MLADKELGKGYWRSARKTQRLVTLHIPHEWINYIDKMVQDGRYPNRSEAIRYMIRFYFDTYEIDYKSSK